MAEQSNEGPQFELQPGTAEVYIDSVHMRTQLYGSTLFLGELRTPPDKPLIRTVVKISPQMAKVLSLILKKHVEDYERNIGPIAIPNELLHNLGLEELI